MGRSMGRAVGRTRELDPAHRRDGFGVALLVLAVISAAGIWFGTGGPVGRGLTTAIGYVVGLGAVVLPVLLAVAGVVLMVATPRPDSRPRIAVGSLLLALGVLGLVHLAAGRPDEPARWSEGGGALGYLAATPLATGLTAWVAAPVLVLLSGYAFLVLTATPVRAGAEPGPAAARPRGDGRTPSRTAERRPPAAAGPGHRRRAGPAAPAVPAPAGLPGGRRLPRRRPGRPPPPTPSREPAAETPAPGPARRARGRRGAGHPAGRAGARPGPVDRRAAAADRRARPRARCPTSCRPATCCPPARRRRPAAAPTTR